MNRIFKFRVWHSKSEIMSDDVTPFQGDNFNFVMQYTGLTDKNGKEIYEGDILRRSFKYGQPETAEVYFNKKTAGFNVKLPENSCLNPILGVYYNAFDNGVEVIGNIYSNPELLGAE